MNASQHRQTDIDGAASDDQSPFERQRARLIDQVALVRNKPSTSLVYESDVRESMESIMTNMNQLNRNLESVISVGKVRLGKLWSSTG